MMYYKKPYLKKIWNKWLSLIHINRTINEVSGNVSELKVQINETKEGIDIAKLLFSKVLIHNNLQMDYSHDIQKAEFKVFSQWGDDGIIQYIINKIEFKTTTFIEFGVQNYLESNTRFLLINNNWSGLVIDGSEDNIKYIKNDPIYWKYNLKAITHFITKENINEIIEEAGYKDEIGILSIDIDGNDYWIWETITIVEPVMVIIEFNAVFGIDRPITIPYSDGFVRENAHFSYLYFGASLSALERLGKEKGYSFIGINSASVNAYFIKTEKLGIFKEKDPQNIFSPSKFRESRDKNNNLNHLNYEDRQKCIRGLPVYNLENNERELF